MQGAGLFDFAAFCAGQTQRCDQTVRALTWRERSNGWAFVHQHVRVVLPQKDHPHEDSFCSRKTRSSEAFWGASHKAPRATGCCTTLYCDGFDTRRLLLLSSKIVQVAIMRPIKDQVISSASRGLLSRSDFLCFNFQIKWYKQLGAKFVRPRVDLARYTRNVDISWDLRQRLPCTLENYTTREFAPRLPTLSLLGRHLKIAA